MSYQVEQRPCAKSGWFTPQEARNYYGRYSREGITVHWWGDGTGASNHDNIVNYLNGRGAKGQSPTANYVLSDAKITECVAPDNVAWTSGNGNATTIGVETQPTLGAEGYKKWGWLVDQLEKRYGRRLTLYKHSNWMSTACPGTISLDRIRQEADKWARGEYNPAPPAPTPPATAKLRWESIPTRKYKTNKQPTHLWKFDATTWSGFQSVKQFNAGEEIEIYGQCVNETLGATYLVTKYSYERKIPNGFNQVDLALVTQPEPTPLPPEPAPTPPPVPQPKEWETNLKDIDNTKMWFKQDQDLIDITTGNPTGTKKFKKDEEFVASALTTARGVEYRITEYSFQKRIYNGVPIDSLTLTPPGTPDVPPEPQPPTPVPDKDAILAFLTMLVKLISDFIKKLGG